MGTILTEVSSSRMNSAHCEASSRWRLHRVRRSPLVSIDLLILYITIIPMTTTITIIHITASRGRGLRMDKREGKKREMSGDRY